MKYGIVGIVGVPGNYGGFETLAEHLVCHHEQMSVDHELTVYCSAPAYNDKPAYFRSAKLEYINVKANGVQSILYDIISIGRAAWTKTDLILLLGVSGAVAIPFLRLFTKTKIITNIDGIEWKRSKWNIVAKLFLKFSEYIAVSYSNQVIADNQEIFDYIKVKYSKTSKTIAYGGDHAVNLVAEPITNLVLPSNYAFSLCRIEPENNVDMILESFSLRTNYNLIFVGNWSVSDYAKSLYAKYADKDNIYLLDPIYNLNKLFWLRDGAKIYIHGHSAGGTNPSLVEMMHFSKPIIAFDCAFNRCTTKNRAEYFSRSSELLDILDLSVCKSFDENAKCMYEIASSDYTWTKVGAEYFALFEKVANKDEQ